MEQGKKSVQILISLRNTDSLMLHDLDLTGGPRSPGGPLPLHP